MLTKPRPGVSRKRSLSIENLESRLNLSSLATVIGRMQTLTSPAVDQSSALKSVKLIPVNLTATNPATDPFANSQFGDTAIGASSATPVDVTGYSTISGSQIEWVNGAPDIGYMSASGAAISYRLNVAAAGTYTLNFGVATPNNAGTFDVSVNGSKQASYSFSGTGSWAKYAGTAKNIYLAAGTSTITLTSTWGSQFNINAISLSPVNPVANPATPAANPSTITVGSSATITADQYSSIWNSKLEWVNGKPDIGYVSAAGSYVEYTLNVQSAGNYNLAISTAAPSAAAISVSVNGAQAAIASVASTGSWSSYNTSNASVYLPAGSVTLRLSSINGTQYNLGGIGITQSSAGSTSAAISVGTSSTTVGADKYSGIWNAKLEWVNGKPDIGYVSTAGSYVEYTLSVAAAGNYSLALSTAAPTAAALSISVNGGSGTSVNVPATGSWSTYGTSSASVYLPAGTVTLRLSSLNGSQYNLAYLVISPASAVAPTPAPIPAPVATPTGPAVSISTQWMTSFSQLNITGTSGSDSIYVTQSGNVITVNANGRATSYTGPFGDIVVKAIAGNDNITIDSSVNIATLVYGGSGNDTIHNGTQGLATVVAIGGSYDTVQGNGWNSSLWADSSDNIIASSAESNGGQVHRVSGFWGGVSTDLSGQNLADPAGTGSSTRLSNNSLWGTGPTMGDINQGQVSDCFLLGPLQTLANTNPGGLREVAVDLGDGTYAVQFKRGGVTTFLRVDGDLPAGGPYASGLEYAHPGASGDLWAPIIEKAYAEFRNGAWNYSSLNSGYFGSVLADLGFGYSSFGAVDANTMYNTISSAIANGKGVTIGTNSSITAGAPLIALHTYTVTAAWKDAWGNGYVTLRNPWGFDGAGSDGNPGDALVTMTIGQLQQNLQAGAVLV